MIRIKKLLINNFKGIKNQIIVDFQKNGNRNQILSGPNDFGKTTIFEALELCITGKFDRIQTFKDVQIKNRSRNKPFFQNTDGENVMIKLLLEKNGQEIIITKLYDDVNSPKRGNTIAKDFIPEDSHSFFFTYLEENNDNFESLAFDENNLVDQLSINQLFLGNEAHVELNSIYYLFNYIQQEESIRFLKQREDIKGSSLAFLFNIEKEENQQMQLEKIVENFRKQKNTIDEEIEILESSQFGLQSIENQNLFELKEINFDKIEPFEDLKEANTFFPSYIEQVDRLITFINIFDTSEYNKSIIFNEINNEILVNDFLLNSLLISNIYTGSLLDQVSNNNQKILRYQKILDLEDDQFITKEDIQEFFDDDQKEKYEMLENQITDINTELGEIGVIISNLISANQMVWSHYNNALDNNHLSDHQCPLCNSDFSNFEQLIQAYEKQIENLTKLNQNKIDEKQKLLETLKLFHRTIKNDVEKFLKENLPINHSYFQFYYPLIY